MKHGVSRALLTVTCFACLSLFHTAYGQQSKVLKVGIASMMSPVEAMKYYQNAIDYIGEQIKRPIRMVHRRTYQEMNSLLEKGEVNVAFICSSPYVHDHERFGVEILIAPTVNGKPTCRSYIIVQNESALNAFSELRNKVFAFTDPESTTGKLYPSYLLKTLGFTPQTYFKRFLYSYSHNRSVEMVAKKIVDGAAVQSSIYEQMRTTGSPYAHQTRIIKRSPQYGAPPLVVTKNIDHALRNQLKDAFLNMGKSAEGKATLAAMMIDGFTEVPDKNYDSVREMKRLVADRSSATGHPEIKKTVPLHVSVAEAAPGR